MRVRKARHPDQQLLGHPVGALLPRAGANIVGLRHAGRPIRRIRPPRPVPRVTPAGPRGLRGNRNFLLLWTGGVASSLGSQLTQFAYPLLALSLGASAAQAGLIGTAGLLTRTVLRLPAGALVDRWDRRRVMLRCDLVRAAVLTLVTVTLFADTVTVWLLVAASALESVFTVFFVPAERAALRTVVHVEQLPAALAVNEVRQHAAELAGPPLGGLLFGLARPLPFLGDAISYVYSFLAITFLRGVPMRAEPTSPAVGGLVRQIAAGLALTWRQPLLRAIALCVAGSNIVYTALLFGVIVVTRAEGASPASIGVMLGAAGVGGLLGAVAASRVIAAAAPATVLLGVFWTGALVIPTMALRPTPTLIAPLLALFMFLTPAANTVLVSSQMAITPADMQGRVFSSILFLSGAGGAAAPVLTGLLMEAAGSRILLLVLGAAMGVVAGAATATRSMRQMSLPAAPARS